MKRFASLSAALVLGVATTASAQEKKEPRPNVEVVFCLDTTGSMGGLIDAAKKKIWSISNQIATGTPTPLLKVGLVAYRDRGDQYVTQRFDLTDDLDAIHGHLQGFHAGGGGDFPESVNQALHEAVSMISWSKDAKTLRMIFLVGDAPPHMDYADDVKYPDTCQKAAKAGIIINTVQCGGHAETRKIWQDICRLAEGSYVQIDASGGPIVAVATPFDADLAKINRELSASTLAFGARAAQESAKNKAEAGGALAPAAAADRAAFFARNGGAASYDLLQQVKDGKVKLSELKKDELPEQLRGLDAAKQKEYLENVDRRRQDLQKQAIELDRKRNAFVAEKSAEAEKTRARDSFDQNVLRILQNQAGRANIRYEIEEKKK